jgi:hypothetical protein
MKQPAWWRFLGPRLRVLAFFPVMFLVGCAQIPMGQPGPSFAVVEKARASGAAPVAVGQFQLAKGADPEIDKGLNVRSNTLFSPVGHSFSRYLREIVIADLGAAGLYDAKSNILISGLLTDSTLEVPTTTGQASLGARFLVTRQGKTVYDKALVVSATWPSSFVGMQAIPEGINHYTALYHELVLKLLSDPDYRSVDIP